MSLGSWKDPGFGGSACACERKAVAIFYFATTEQATLTAICLLPLLLLLLLAATISFCHTRTLKMSYLHSPFECLLNTSVYVLRKTAQDGNNDCWHSIQSNYIRTIKVITVLVTISTIITLMATQACTPGPPT